MGSTTSPPDVTYGFIGLGNMGFGMAKNVRQKIPASSNMIVCELVKSQRDEFTSTIEGKLETAETPKEIAEKCVCMLLSCACESSNGSGPIFIYVEANVTIRILSSPRFRTQRL